MTKKYDRSPLYSTAIVQIPLLVRDAGRVHKAKTPECVAEMFSEIKDYAVEVFCVAMLDAKNGLITKEMVTKGLVDASLVHPREIFRAAIQRNASALILVHNHPSGDPTPSAEDLRITKQLVIAGKIIDINVLDHVIIGRDLESNKTRHQSLRESGLISFS